MEFNNPQNDNLRSQDSWNDDLLWEDIATALDKDKKKRRGFWWIIGSFIMILSIAAICVNSYYNKDLKSLNTAQISEEEIRNNHNIKKSKQLTTAPSRDFSSSNNRKDTTSDSAVVVEKTKKASALFPEYGKGILTDKINPNSKEEIIKEEIDQTKTNNLFSVSSKRKSTKGEQKFLCDSLIHPVASLPILTTIAIPEKKELHQLSEVSSISCTPPIIKNQGFLSLSTGYSILSNEENGQSFWAQKMKGAETALYATNTLITYNHPVYKRIYLGLGINYKRQISSFKAINADTSYTEVMSDTAKIINSISIPGKLTRTKTTTTSYSTYNRYHTVSLPISLSFVYKQGRHSLTLTTDVQLYLGSEYKGLFFSSNGTILDFRDTSVQRPQFLNLQNASGSVDYSRAFNNDISMFIGGRFTMPFNDNYQIGNNESYSSRTTEYNLFLGIRKKI